MKNTTSIVLALVLLTVTSIFPASKSLGQRCHDLNIWMEANTDRSNDDKLFTSASNVPLLNLYPNLAADIPYFPFATLPTPVTHLENLGVELNHQNLFLKNDAGSGVIFGGNKIRKLCFLLGWALFNKAELILTCGGAGSNHSTATIACSKLVKLPCESFLTAQRPTAYTQRNLLLSQFFGGTLSQYSTMNERQQAILDRAAVCNKKVFYIPGGGSTARGSLGFVNAALELKQQIDKGEVPEPDVIFVGAGSNGTAAGLGLGCNIAGLKSQIIAICTTSMSPDAFMEDCKELYAGMLDLLKIKTPQELRYPIYDASYFGDGYAHIPQETAQALKLMLDTENLRLDGTYAGKAVTAFIDYARRDENKGKNILFWNTFCTGNLESLGCDNTDYTTLPESFHHYFTDPLQAGDLGV